VSSSIVEHSLAARALAAAGDAIITVDTAGRITSWNEAARRLLGYSPQDAIGQTLALIIPPEHRPRHMAGFHAALDSGRLAHSGAVARVEAATASGTVDPGVKRMIMADSFPNVKRPHPCYFTLG